MPCIYYFRANFALKVVSFSRVLRFTKFANFARLVNFTLKFNFKFKTLFRAPMKNFVGLTIRYLFCVVSLFVIGSHNLVIVCL